LHDFLTCSLVERTEFFTNTCQSNTLSTCATIVGRRQVTAALVIIRIPKILTALEEVRPIPASAIVVPSAIQVRLATIIRGRLWINALRYSVRANGWNAVPCALIGDIASVVSIVALAGCPWIALRAEVEFPPDAVEDIGARVAAVHLAGNVEVGRDSPIGVACWCWGIDLEGGCTIRRVGADRQGTRVVCAGRSLEMDVSKQSSRTGRDSRSLACSH
jgi:hypothetical protein